MSIHFAMPIVFFRKGMHTGAGWSKASYVMNHSLRQHIWSLAPESMIQPVSLTGCAGADWSGSPSFLHSSIVHISYSSHPFLHPLDCARAFYYTFWLSFVSLLHTPMAHISFVHIRSSTFSLLHSAFSTQSDCAQCLYYTSRFNTTNPPHPFPAQLDCAGNRGRYNSHKYLTRVK